MKVNEDQSAAVESAAATIWQRWNSTASVAIILGTGLSNMSHRVTVETTIPFEEIPGFPLATAIGHRGRVVCGQMSGAPVIMLDGRCHLYEGYSLEQISLPVRVMHASGADTLVVSNASGGLNPNYAPGDVVIVRNHIDLMSRRPSVAELANACDSNQSEAPSPYDAKLIREALALAHQQKFAAHLGVYVAVTGPNYETRAEYRFLRKIGGDVVGMSTSPEATVARELGMRVLGLSIVTNVAHPDAPETVNAGQVIDAAQRAEPIAAQIVERVLAK